MKILRQTTFALVLVAAPAASADDAVPTSTPPPPGGPSTDNSVPAPAPAPAPVPTAPVAAASLSAIPATSLAAQAPAGGITYGLAGVREFGAAAGLMLAPDFRDVSFSPSLGWFIADNLELSAIGGIANIKAAHESATMLTALVEPSYHVPFNPMTSGFLGLGIGGAYLTELGGGIAVAPRLGASFRVGRAGLLTPSLSYQYTTHHIATIGDTDANTTLISASSTLRINIGYTAIW